MANNYMKKKSSALVTREMQIEATLQFHFNPIRMAFSYQTNTDRCWQGCREPYKLLVGMRLGASTVEIIAKGPP